MTDHRRPPAATDDDGIEPPALKKQKLIEKEEPLSFVTWNCNGLVSRCKGNGQDLKRLVKECESPDVVCLQEVRLKAFDSTQRNRPKTSEFEIVKETIQTTFGDYQPFWSLADSRYAGTLTLLHKRVVAQQGLTAFTPDAAMNILLKRHGKTHKDVGINKKEKAVPVKAAGPRQSSMTQFFKAKTMTTTASNNNIKKDRQEHTKEGRFQFFVFSNLDIIQTYVPNNGLKQESFERRKAWDEKMLQLFTVRKRLGETKPILWLGDFNCALQYLDGTHYEISPFDGSIYEWWCDETKCFTAGTKLDPNRGSENRGIASFTESERRRLNKIIKEGDLIDVWRTLHPEGTSHMNSDGTSGEKNDSNLSKWEQPNWTWRGHLGKEGGFGSKYQGKGQRIDYFLLSSTLKDRVESCDILGFGSKREGLFCGSDHCVSRMVFKKRKS